MEVRRTAEKRQHAEDETHEEAEKIEVRPGHNSPRAQHVLLATCGARAGIRDSDPVAFERPTTELTPFNYEVKKRAADGRCPSVLRSDDFPDATLLRDVPPNPACGEFLPGAESPGANLHARRWL